MTRYITPKEAFELSGCPDERDFMERLNRLLQEGLPSKSRLNYPADSPLRDTPPETWDEGKLAIGGTVRIERPERLREEDRNTAVGVIVISDGII